jgi:hypothetical protein
VTDRVEDAVAWLLMAAALALLAVAGLTGVAVHSSHSEAESSALWAHAVLLEDADTMETEFGVGMPTRVLARWTDRGGVERTGEVLVTAPKEAGTEVDVRLEADGQPSMRLQPESAAAAGIVSAGSLLLGGGTVLIALWLGVRRLTGVANARRWEREWERVGPDWTGRPR